VYLTKQFFFIADSWSISQAQSNNIKSTKMVIHSG